LQKIRSKHLGSMDKGNNIVEEIKNSYVNISENSWVMYLRGVIQSLDVPLPIFGLSINLGQVVDRFLFIEAEKISKKRIEASFKELNKKIKKIEINQKNVLKNIEEYSNLIFRFSHMTGSQSYKKLRDAYINQMSYFLNVKYTEKTNRLFYQQLLFKLSIDHLYILKYSEKYLGVDRAINSQPARTLNDAIISEFKRKGLDEPLLRGLLKDLDSLGLLGSWQSSAMGGDIHYLSLTDLGRKVLFQIKDNTE